MEVLAHDGKIKVVNTLDSRLEQLARQVSLVNNYKSDLINVSLNGTMVASMNIINSIAYGLVPCR